jgi:predicted RNA binding protein with dsRBD fold (UPF0201 family)
MKLARITKDKKKVKKAKKKPFDYLQYRVEVYDADKLQVKKKITNMSNEQTRIIKEIIKEKQIRQGKNGRDYLLLKLDNNETIFVFPNKDTPDDR